MQTFKQYLENRPLLRSDMDNVEGIPSKDMAIRDPNLQQNAQKELIDFFRDHNKVMQFLTNPEVRSRLIPLIEKEPYLKRVIDDLSGGKYGFSSLTTRQDRHSSFPDKF